MKAETKAKRRVTLSIAGLGWLDETELETIPRESPRHLPQIKQHRQRDTPDADQISSLVEMARSCGVDLISFGNHMRRLMHLAEDTKITKKFLRESMTMAQYERAWQHYNEVLKNMWRKMSRMILLQAMEYPRANSRSGSHRGRPTDGHVRSGLHG